MMKKISYCLCLFAALSLLLVACQQDDNFTPNKVPAGKVKLNITPTGMGQHIVTTRNTAKNPDETEIHNLHVFFFDGNSEGNTLLQPASGSSGEEGKSYRYLEDGKSTLLIDGAQFQNPSNVTIYVLANLAEGSLTENSDGKPQTTDGKVIEKLQDIEEYIYKPYGEKNFTTRIPSTGLPMVGHITGQNFNQTGQVIDIDMKSLMARIDFNITMNPTYKTGEFPILQITRIDMKNMPGGARIGEYTAGEESETEGNCSSFGETTFTLRDGQSTSFSFYVFEHLRKTNGKTLDPSIKDEYKQRYKPDLAKDDAAYVLLTGQYYDNGGHLYNVTYTLYLGANHTDDFNITRNCKYINNISVKGITAVNHPDNPDDVVGLDARVTVSRETNDFYISILRERDHDAHFNVTPMDVYIPKDGTVTITIPNPDTDNIWIRLESVDASLTPAEGYGKRDYFTTDLLTNTLNGATNKSCDLEGESAETEKLTQRRVYLYIDENISTTSRNVELEIYYTPKGGAKTLAQKLLIEQKGLVKVYYDKRTYYIESYEEYRNYFDPLSEFDTSMRYDEGLPWGDESSSRYGSISNSPVNTYDQSPNFTLQILEAYNDDGKMTLNDKPSSAAAYCYNKNKRNPDTKNVDKVKWCLPSVRELEGALVTQYYQFPEFQGAYYWSCNVPRNTPGGITTNDGYLNQSTSRARATQIIHDLNNDSQYDTPAYGTVSGYSEYVYANSNWDDWHSGWRTDYRQSPGNKSRTDKCRIRAIYIPDANETIK